MRPIDDDPDSGSTHDGPSRSERRRDALDVLRMAGQLAQMSDAQLAAVPLAADVHREVIAARGTDQHIARKRQVQFLAKCLRREDDATLEEIRIVLEQDRLLGRRENAQLQRVERWRERLLDEGDAALTQFITEHPQADRQQLRQLVRQARQEAAHDKPPRATRELFRSLRSWM